MPQGRPPISAQLKRDLLVEAGHRCAIPTCRAAEPLEFEHIDDWAKVKKHEFANMIVLCRNCHGRKGSRPGQIDRKALMQYKANLAVVNGRYGELELRILDAVARKPLQTEFVLPAYMGLMVSYLIKDGLLRRHETMQDYKVRTEGIFALDLSVAQWYEITEKGIDFIERWKSARPLD
ncbi:HNH endonuclease [Nonomuraea basaltis]|uniref:HNH endonuclease n=1 Tax=Nonomuraea basaltis TaxID=2495887 RepID=UPI00110C4D92|nr:HNH endonuclease signature motif containing protein [Nonomuraea basaltis]TMR91441.1 HNH endonuclease [Nonomuraea basaltis]